MARIRLIHPSEAEGRVKEIFQEIEAIRGAGRVSNLLRAYANHVPSLESNWYRMKHLLKSGLLPSRVKEMIGLTMAALYKCGYWVKFHSTALRAEGGSIQEVQEVLGVPELRGTRLTRREVLILQFCRQAALDANAITEAQVAELKTEGFSDAEIVEMIETMNFTTAHTKIVDALEIEADPWLDEPGGQRRE